MNGTQKNANKKLNGGGHGGRVLLGDIFINKNEYDSKIQFVGLFREAYISTRSKDYDRSLQCVYI